MTTTTVSPDAIPDRPRGGAETWYEVLDVAADATPAEIRRGFERALELVEGRTIGGYFLLDPVAVQSARADIDAAWAVLSDPERRAAYDRSRGLAASAPSSSSTTPTTSTPRTTAESGAPTPPASHDPRPDAPADASAVDEDTARAGLGLRSAPPSPTTTSSAPAEVPRTRALRFLSPVVDDTAKAPPRAATPGSSAGIVFQPPKTDVPAATPTAPADASSSAPTLVATATVLPTAVMPPPGPATTTTIAVQLPLTSSPTPVPASLFNLDGEVNGLLLRRLREARRLSLDELAEATKIRKPYLVAIEEQDLENLPARVYLRGFLTQIARVLKVDKQKLADGYLAFVARYGK